MGSAAYSIRDLQDDMPVIIPGESNESVFHTIYCGHTRFCTLASKTGSVPLSFADLPSPYRMHVMDDITPIKGILQSLLDGCEPSHTARAFTSACNRVFEESLRGLGLSDCAYQPVAESDIAQISESDEGGARAMRATSRVLAWAYQGIFCGVSGLVGRELMCTRRMPRGCTQTLDEYCKRCAHLRMTGMQARWSEMSREPSDRAESTAAALGWIYSSCVQFYADVINKRIVWASMYVKADGAGFELLSERVGVNHEEIVSRGICALLRRKISYSKGTPIQTIVCAGAVECIGTGGGLPLDSGNLLHLDRALDIDSYYAMCIYKGR